MKRTGLRLNILAFIAISRKGATFQELIKHFNRHHIIYKQAAFPVILNRMKSNELVIRKRGSICKDCCSKICTWHITDKGRDWLKNEGLSV